MNSRHRKAKTRHLPPNPLTADDTQCGICLDVVVMRGKIGPCSHLYCFNCLLEWSKVINSCPQCKRTFRSISKIEYKTGSLQEKVFVKDRTQIKESQSSDDEYGYVDSEEIEDSDPDFIDNDIIDDKLLSDDETELYHLDSTRSNKAPFKRKKSAISSSESESDIEVHSPPSTLASKLSGKLRKHSSSNKENEVPCPSKSKRLNAPFNPSKKVVLTRKKKATKKPQRVGIKIATVGSQSSNWIQTSAKTKSSPSCSKGATKISLPRKKSDVDPEEMSTTEKSFIEMLKNLSD